MNFLKVGDGKFINPDRVTYIEAKRRNKVLIQFQNEVSAGGLGVPMSFLELDGDEAEAFLRWLNSQEDKIG